MAEYDVQGIRETMAVLKQIDPTLQRQAVKNVKNAAESVVQEARGRIPAVPTGVRRGRPNWNRWSGRDWDPAQVRRGIKTRVRATRGKGPYDRPLVSIIQSSAAGAIFDMAGKTGQFTRSAQGQAFNRALSAYSGRPSRSMWPALEAKIDEVNRAMDEAVKEMEHEVNARLGGFAGISRLI